jgi:hypothetical protein
MPNEYIVGDLNRDDCHYFAEYLDALRYALKQSRRTHKKVFIHVSEAGSDTLKGFWYTVSNDKVTEHFLYVR